MTSTCLFVLELTEIQVNKVARTHPTLRGLVLDARRSQVPSYALAPVARFNDAPHCERPLEVECALPARRGTCSTAALGSVFDFDIGQLPGAPFLVDLRQSRYRP